VKKQPFVAYGVQQAPHIALAQSVPSPA